MTENELLNARIFKDVSCCRCGARHGAYVMKDEDGYWNVCDDCDLPVYGSYRLFGEIPRRRDEDCDED